MDRVYKVIIVALMICLFLSGIILGANYEKSNILDRVEIVKSMGCSEETLHILEIVTNKIK